MGGRDRHRAAPPSAFLGQGSSALATPEIAVMNDKGVADAEPLTPFVYPGVTHESTLKRPVWQPDRLNRATLMMSLGVRASPNR
jgi:hypothetical protein